MTLATCSTDLGEWVGIIIGGVAIGLLVFVFTWYAAKKDWE